MKNEAKFFTFTVGLFLLSQGLYGGSSNDSKNGTLWAWGANGSGQLGDGTTDNSPDPVQETTGLNDWSSVSAGGNHTIAIKTDGTLWAWGANGSGQLGDGTTDNSPDPVQETTGLNDWSSVSAGGNHTIAIKTDGVNPSNGGKFNPSIVYYLLF